MLFVDVSASNPPHPSLSKMGIIIGFFHLDCNISPGLSIEGRDRDSCLDFGWNTCGILKLRLVEYSKRFSLLGDNDF